MVVEGANPGPRPKAVRLRGVRVHNLKGVDLDVPIGRLVVFTGVSGSGKSSLAFDTLYAEGQRRYVETFSPYTRQFLEALEKPDADLVDGVPPAVAVAQRGGGRRSARSTLGTVTEVAEGLGLLYARVGRVICMSCGAPVEPAGPAAVARAIDALPEGTRYQITFPVDVRPGSDLATLAAMLVEDGFTRTWVNGRPGSLVEGPPPAPDGPDFDVVVDRLVRGPETSGRRLDSIEIAFAKGLGRCRIVTESHVSNFYDGWRCGTCGTDHIAPDPRLFRFNSPLGACPGCSGFGRIIEPDLARIVPDPSKTLRDGAIAPWTTPAYRNWLDDLVRAAPRLGLPLDVPFASLSPAQVATLTQGGPGFAGLRGFFAKLETKVYKVHVRVFLSRWRGERPCPTCKGARLRPEALAVRVLGRNVAEVAAMGVGEARAFLDEVARAEADNPVARRALGQVAPRLDYLQRIGLGYLTLDRPARTLSGGEARRVALTAALGSGLVNTLYVLDEPTVGLHPRDVGRLIASIQALRDSGNSPVVVEHDADLIRAADEVVDVGPGAGEAGGRILYQGPPAGLQAMEGSATGDYLAGRRKVATPSGRRTSTGMIRLEGASGNNLRNIDVEFPLGVLVIVTGVSGSGKSTLIDRTLQPAVRRGLGEDVAESAPYVAIRGVDAISAVEAVDQSPIGRTARSNPVTYLKAFDEIRKAFAATPEAKARNYTASKFSFNVEGGRCDACDGLGYQTIDMQFLADVLVRCPECRGARYRPEILQVTDRGKSIADVLELTAREAFGHFRNRPQILARLRPLLEVGLDYLRLGQPASTLSGGEAQRLKLASFLASTPGAMARAAGGPKTLFLLDEPTAGLHPADTAKLLESLDSLLAVGHSLIIVEHDPAVMLAADWIIDLGPDAGTHGGLVVAQGPPEHVARTDTHTGRALAVALERKLPTRVTR